MEYFLWSCLQQWDGVGVGVVALSNVCVFGGGGGGGESSRLRYSRQNDGISTYCHLIWGQNLARFGELKSEALFK